MTSSSHHDEVNPTDAVRDAVPQPSTECDPARCEQALAELEEYLDGQLDEDRLADIRAHLSACYPCTDRATFEEQLRAIVRRDCMEHAPDSLVTRIHAVLDDADA